MNLEELQRMEQEYRIDPRIRFAAMPCPPWDGYVEIKLEGDKQKSWKIHFPVTSDTRVRMQYLRDKGGNYRLALDNIKYAIKHEAITKSDFENQLRRELDQAK